MDSGGWEIASPNLVRLFCFDMCPHKRLTFTRRLDTKMGIRDLEKRCVDWHSTPRLL